LKTSELLQPIVQEILDRLDRKDVELGGQYWTDPNEEPLKFFVQNMERKKFIIDKVFNRNDIDKSKAVLDDSTLDYIGYSLLFEWRLRNKGE